MIAIKKDVALAPFTSFQIGGPARYFTEVADAEQLQEALLFARDRDLPYRILGGGTNVLVNDSGFPGLVIKASLSGLTVAGSALEAEAGVELMRVVQHAAACGLSGIESLAGIPGSLGGAVRGNAGAYGTSIGDVVVSVQALDMEKREVVLLGREECSFRYRDSFFKRRGDMVVLCARLALCHASPPDIFRKVEETVAKRLAKNLQAERSVGSYFMNPVISDPALIEAFETERKLRCRDNRIPAGWFIDTLGLRNKKMGGAMVSEKHANYIINTGGASASDVLRLADAIKTQVRERMGIELHEEVCYVGF
jgi:UDP-N-acetylmuramate dehydrogenase